MINLTQNPTRRPSASIRLPTLLTYSFIWALRENQESERQLLPLEHFVAMGVPVYETLVGPHAAHPHCKQYPSGPQCKKLAGNASCLEFW